VGSFLVKGNSWADTFPTPSESESIIFSDQFALGNKNYEHPTTGANWIGNGVSSTVVADPGNSTGFALRQRYGAGGNWSEQRFYLGPDATAGAYNDLWIKYRVFFPSNFRSQSGLPNNEGINNKFIRLWHGDLSDNQEGYQDYIIKGGWSTIATSNGESNYRTERGSNADGVGAQGSGENRDGFIDPVDYGTEITWVMRMKLDTIGTPGLGHGSASGNARQTIWKNGTLLHDVNNVHWRSEDGTGEFFEYGYTFGYANSRYAEQTDLLVRELSIATENVFGVSY
jgi:hypothetical protein